MKIAINAWAFDESATIGQMVQTTADAGFDAIELTMAEEGPLTFETSEAECRRIAATVADAGLQMASLATARFWQVNYGHPDPAVRTQAREMTLAMLDRAAWLGASAILVVPAVVGFAANPDPVASYVDALNRSYDALLELAPHAEARNVTIAIENVHNRFLLTPVEVRDLIDQVNSPHVGVYLDVGNVMAFGYPSDWIETLGQRIACVHIKDYRLRGPDGPGGCALGEGDVDFGAVIASLRKINFSAPLTFEGKGDPSDIARLMRSWLTAAQDD